MNIVKFKVPEEMTDSKMRYMSLEKCANTDQILVFEHKNAEEDENFNVTEKKGSLHVYDSVEDATNDQALLSRKVRKPFLRRLTSLMGRKTKNVHDVNGTNDKLEMIHSPRQSKSSSKNHFDSSRIKILVEMNQDSLKSSTTRDNDKSSLESCSSVSMMTDLVKDNSFNSTTWVDFDEEQLVFTPSTKKHERHDSHGTKSTVLSFDKSILSMISSCLDNAVDIANCNFSKMNGLNSEDSITNSYCSYDDKEESDNDCYNNGSLNSF
jgi:hypothetical protein